VITAVNLAKFNSSLTKKPMIASGRVIYFASARVPYRG